MGGIYANFKFPAEFIYKNLMIETNIIHSAFLCGIKKILFLGSSCIYPKKLKLLLKKMTCYLVSLNSLTSLMQLLKLQV